MSWVGPQESLDARLYYTGDQARDWIQSLDSVEKKSYFFKEILDLLFICLYSSLFFQWASRLFKSSTYLSWVGFIPGSFDLIETTAIVFILKQGDSFEILDGLGYITFLKWSSGFVVVLVLGFQKLKVLRTVSTKKIN